VSKNTGAKANWILLVRASIEMFIGGFERLCVVRGAIRVMGGVIVLLVLVS
jgi:hypothetical protein